MDARQAQEVVHLPGLEHAGLEQHRLHVRGQDGAQLRRLVEGGAQPLHLLALEQPLVVEPPAGVLTQEHGRGHGGRNVPERHGRLYVQGLLLWRILRGLLVGEVEAKRVQVVGVVLVGLVLRKPAPHEPQPVEHVGGAVHHLVQLVGQVGQVVALNLQRHVQGVLHQFPVGPLVAQLQPLHCDSQGHGEFVSRLHQLPLGLAQVARLHVVGLDARVQAADQVARLVHLVAQLRVHLLQLQFVVLRHLVLHDGGVLSHAVGLLELLLRVLAEAGGALVPLLADAVVVLARQVGQHGRGSGEGERRLQGGARRLRGVQPRHSGPSPGHGGRKRRVPKTPRA
mmetsp:Transcript_12956/g.24684  ORF Transcript_12956/g.24684 Transcript_12956/m.24684 type:complete len:339 (-) Transcript_12956:59-1075(-)